MNGAGKLLVLHNFLAVRIGQVDLVASSRPVVIIRPDDQDRGAPPGHLGGKGLHGNVQRRCRVNHHKDIRQDIFGNIKNVLHIIGWGEGGLHNLQDLQCIICKQEQQNRVRQEQVKRKGEQRIFLHKLQATHSPKLNRDR